jgi:hypothetical protein
VVGSVPAGVVIHHAQRNGQQGRRKVNSPTDPVDRSRRRYSGLRRTARGSGVGGGGGAGGDDRVLHHGGGGGQITDAVAPIRWIRALNTVVRVQTRSGIVSTTALVRHRGDLPSMGGAGGRLAPRLIGALKTPSVVPR